MAGHMVSGYAWMITQTVTSQVVNILGALVLARLLTTDEYGLFIQTMIISAFGALTNQIGIRAVLVNRAKAWNCYANPATWMLGALGLVVGGSIAASSGLIESAFTDADGLAPLVAVIAIGVPFNAVTVVAESGLQVRLRFRTLATVQFVRLTAEMALMVALAWSGFGPWALVIPRLLAIVLTTVVLFVLARPTLRWRPQLRRWPLMLRDVPPLFTAAGCNYFMGQLDRIALSLFQSSAVVGVYGFAMRLALRPVIVLGQSLEKVLFPVLRTMHEEPERQAAAFARAERLLAVVAAPLCLLTALGAQPLFAVALPEKWFGSIIVLQVIGPAILFLLVGKASGALLDARGAYGLKARLNMVQVVAYAIALIPAAREGLLHAAVAYVVVTAIFGIVCPAVALRGLGHPIRRAIGIYIPAVPAGAITAGLAVAALAGLEHVVDPASALAPWIDGAAVAIVVLVAYPAFVRVISPATWRDASDRARELVQRRRGRRAPASD